MRSYQFDNNLGKITKVVMRGREDYLNRLTALMCYDKNDKVLQPIGNEYKGNTQTILLDEDERIIGIKARLYEGDNKYCWNFQFIICKA